MSESREDLPALPYHGQTQALDADSVARTKPFYSGLPTGTGIGKYRILERIRTYHNAVVYKARDLMLDRLVAVKQMTPDLIDNPVACGNFRREAQLLARIPKDSRYIFNIHELIEDEIGLFIVEEFVPGHWLESLIFKRQVDHRDAYKLLKTAATGLRTLHANMIVHRDVHPGNVMVTRSGGAKIANLSSAAHEGDLSPPPIITPQYAAPELLLEKRYDNRVDIYGLGMVIYEVCVGRQAIERHFADIFQSPFPVGRWIEWQTDFTQNLPDACELNPRIPPQLAAILRRMTAKDLDQRYTSMDAVLDAISAFFSSQQADAQAALRRDKLEDAAYSAGRRSRARYLPLPHEYPLPDPSEGPTAEPIRRRTSTHTVRPAHRDYAETYRWERAAARGADAFVGPTPTRRGLHRRGRRTAAGLTAHRPQMITVIPALPKVHEVHKKHTPRIITWTLTFLLLIVTGSAAGGGIWYFFYGPGAVNPIELMIHEGVQEYERGNFSVAQARFEEAREMQSNHRDAAAWRDRSKFWLELTAAQLALENDQYDTVTALLRSASKRGVNPGRVDELQQRAWLKRDAKRLAAEGLEHLAEGNLFAVESTLDEYAEKAAAVGMDPSTLKDGLNLTRRELKQQEYLKQAADALRSGDLLEASTACERAESIQITSATRELRGAIDKARARKQWADKGDQAMLDQDFIEAERCYVRAIEIMPGFDLERKARLARAHVLVAEAEVLFKSGDLLEAEKKLKSSLWNSPTPSAQSRYARHAAAFDAARLVQRADREHEAGRHEMAVELYERALPHLPPPADEHARQKLLEARRSLLISRGDAALEAGDMRAALRAYEEAHNIRRGEDSGRRLSDIQPPPDRPSR